jgi:hypothetical protein
MMIISDFKGKSVSGLDGEAAAQRLRGHVGTTVKVKVLDVFPYPQHLLSVVHRFISFDGYGACFTLRTSN